MNLITGLLIAIPNVEVMMVSIYAFHLISCGIYIYPNSNCKIDSDKQILQVLLISYQILSIK